jgi:3-oxoacyl-[acyl-carrier-protein] synthase II
MKRVVVTGIGVITPIGKNIKAYNNALKNGESGAAGITLFDPSVFKTQFACEVKDFDPNEYMDRKVARRMDRFSQFAMASSKEAMIDAGLVDATFNPERAGVIWASGIGGLRSLEVDIEDFEKNGRSRPRYNPFMIPKMISDIAAGYISIEYGFRGVNFATVSACASASHSISVAADNIRLGKSDIIITGGSEAAITTTGIGGFNAMKALSERNDDPQAASRPFDKDRDGFVLGEGAGAIILEEYEHAKARGAKIYGEIAGTGATADAYHITAPHPEGLGASAVMRIALEDAKMNIGDIDYINVHGTSTPLGDIAESKAILKIFGDHAYNLNISSTKSMTGHLLGAAGAVELIAGILALQDQYIPPTINHFTDDPDIDPKLNLTFNTAQERKVNAVLSNTFGFGGHNSSVIVRKLP